MMGLYRGHPAISLHRMRGSASPSVVQLRARAARADTSYGWMATTSSTRTSCSSSAIFLDRVPIWHWFPGLLSSWTTSARFSARSAGRGSYESNHMSICRRMVRARWCAQPCFEDIGGYREDLGAQDGLRPMDQARSRHKCANVNLPLFYYSATAPI